MVKYSVIKFLFEKFPLRRVEYVQSYIERGGVVEDIVLGTNLEHIFDNDGCSEREIFCI